MGWLIGIDEAGYGPNLGPLVQTAVGFRVPGDPGTCDLWHLLASAVRRHGNNDDRLVIDDSKKVYAATDGLGALEAVALATVVPPEQCPGLTLGRLVERVAPDCRPDLDAEPGFAHDHKLPITAAPEAVVAAGRRFLGACAAAGLNHLWVRSVVTTPARFNARLDAVDNKAEVLAHGLCALIREGRRAGGDGEPVLFAVDRQGGRRYHAALLQSVCPDGWVHVEEETADRCRYRMTVDRELRWTFQVRAESEFLPVALASMVSKYLREALMVQLNAFWRRHVPGLEPTAGYPQDAKRFRAAIDRAMKALGIAEHVVWRRK